MKHTSISIRAGINQNQWHNTAFRQLQGTKGGKTETITSLCHIKTTLFLKLTRGTGLYQLHQLENTAIMSLQESKLH